MGYSLGVDLGTTYTAAAVLGGSGHVETVALGNRTPAAPSVVYVGPDETLLVGEPAERRAQAEPDRVARQFKRRFGDPVPLILGGVPFSSEAVTSRVLRTVVAQVGERMGGPPDAVALTHPANWGPYKLDLLGQAVRMAGLGDVVLLSEPEAAARWYAASERIAPGEIVAVYDLGGGTFDAAVLRRTEEAFEFLGRPEGVERLGGIDFDEAVFRAVAARLDGALERVDPDSPADLADLARLREECVAAKEALSFDTEVSVPVSLRDLRTEVRLSRAEVEGLLRPALRETVQALHRALESAGVTPDQVGRVLLVGGSSRMPLVAELVGAELGRPVSVDADPKHAVARGAALAAAGRTGLAAAAAAAAGPAAPAGPPSPAAAPPAARPPSVAAAPPAAGPPPVAATPPAAGFPPAPAVPAAVPGQPPFGWAPGPPGAGTGPQTTGAGRSRKGLGIAVGVAALVALAVVGFLVLRNGGGGDGGGGQELVADPTVCPEAPSICITGLRAVDGALLADFRTNGLDLSFEGAEAIHAQFFFTDDTAGAIRWGSADPFGTGGAGFTTRQASTRALCVLLADSSERTFPGTGNCVEVPAIGS